MPQTLPQQYDSSKFLLVAVNILLQSINERPIHDDVELAELEEAQLAKSTIIEVKKEVLSQKWDINTDTQYSFPQDPAGFIPIPANVLNIFDVTGDLIMRDWRLYSKRKQSAIFSSPQKVSVVWDLEFNSLAHPIRHYITIKAARIFQARTINDTTTERFSAGEEEEAYLSARRAEGDTGQMNMLTSAYGVENFVLGA